MKYLPKLNLQLNLQLFAAADDDEEELISGSVPDDDEEEIEDPEQDEDQEEQDEDDIEIDDEDEVDEPLDKKTKSIIKHKKEAKELKKQLQEANEKLLQVEIDKERATRISELTKTGISSTEATKIAGNESEVKQLRLKLTTMELEKLEDKIPGIAAYSRQLSEDKAKTPEFSYEQLYLAKYSKQNAYDQKTKIEQELLYKNKSSKSKSLESGSTKTVKPTKLSSDDERVYNYLKGQNKTLTRKQYKALLESDEME